MAESKRQSAEDVQRQQEEDQKRVAEVRHERKWSEGRVKKSRQKKTKDMRMGKREIFVCFILSLLSRHLRELISLMPTHFKIVFLSPLVFPAFLLFL